MSAQEKQGELMSPPMSAGTRKLSASSTTPATDHRSATPHGARRLPPRTGEVPALAALLLSLIALLAGCGSSATIGPTSTPTRSAAAAASTPTTAHIFRSRYYGYTDALPSGWSSNSQATQPWDGKGTASDQDRFIDLFYGPGGLEAWAVAAPTNRNLAVYTTATIRAAAASHPCPTTPQTNQAITIGGEPARLLNMQCPPGSGFVVEIVTTIHHGTAYVFASQNPSGSAANHTADRAAFRKFLAGIQFQR